MLGDMRRRGRRRRVGLGGSERLLPRPAVLHPTHDPVPEPQIPAIALASVFLSIHTNRY